MNQYLNVNRGMYQHSQSRAHNTAGRSPRTHPSCTGALLATLCLVLCVGCGAPKRSVGPAYHSPARTATILSAGDIVRIVFPGAPEHNQSQKIRGDGKITLPMIGEVDAAGRRPGELQSELTRRYEKQLTNNEVIVTLESGAVPVYISGAVRKPGKLVFDRPTNLLEVIAESGGFTPEANVRKIRIIRVVNGEHQSQIIDLKPALSGQPARAVYVRANDVIHVGENFLNF